MPYRRLPNTDSARIKALSTALQKGEGVPPMDLCFHVSTFQEIKYFLPEFKQGVQIQKESYDRQVEKSKHYHESMRKAKLYISHFIQVMNFAISRGELKENTRNYFNLQQFDKKLPPMNTEKELIQWGEKLIEGEQQRTAEGNTAITNPNIARVRVRFDEFVRAYKNQKHLQEASHKAQLKTAELRKKADDLILKLWNEIEEHFSKLEPQKKREHCAQFGIVYVYRKEEKMNFDNLKLDQVG